MYFTPKIRNIPDAPQHVSDPEDEDPPNLHVAPEQLGPSKALLVDDWLGHSTTHILTGAKRRE